MLELPARPRLRSSPTVKMALYDDLSPALWPFLASITIKGLMLTRLWAGCSKTWQTLVASNSCVVKLVRSRFTHGFIVVKFSNVQIFIFAYRTLIQKFAPCEISHYTVFNIGIHLQATPFSIKSGCTMTYLPFFSLVFSICTDSYA